MSTSVLKDMRSGRAAAAAAGFWAGLRGASVWLARVYRARAAMRCLGAMTEGELRDIGLMRQDLWDMGALAHDRDPTDVLAARVRERRSHRRRRP